MPRLLSKEEAEFRMELQRRINLLKDKFPIGVKGGSWQGIYEAIRDAEKRE